MTNKEILTQDLINLIHACATRLNELNEYTEEEMTISDEDCYTVTKARQDITKMTLINEMSF